MQKWVRQFLLLPFSRTTHLSRTSIEDDSRHKIDLDYYIDSDLLFTTIQFTKENWINRFNQGLIREIFNEFINLWIHKFDTTEFQFTRHCIALILLVKLDIEISFLGLYLHEQLLGRRTVRYSLFLFRINFWSILENMKDEFRKKILLNSKPKMYCNLLNRERVIRNHSTAFPWTWKMNAQKSRSRWLWKYVRIERMENVAIHRLWETLMDDRTTCVCAWDTSHCCDFIKNIFVKN